MTKAVSAGKRHPQGGAFLYSRLEDDMPERARVEDFVATVVSGDHVGAIRDSYHEHATMQENLGEPREGRDALIAHEEAALARIHKMHTHPAKAVLVDGDNVTINWIFDIVGEDGSVRRLEELSLLTWDGDRISKEQFFYDSATAWRRADVAEKR